MDGHYLDCVVYSMPEDYYKILGVSRDSSEKDIKKAYRKLARKWHPDINLGNKAAEQKFKVISMAYDCLSKPEKKKLYDEFGEDSLNAGFNAEKAREYKQWGAYDERARGEDQGAQEFGRYQRYEDIFGDLFSAGGRTRGFKTGMADRGRDVEHDMTIDLMSALKGFETELSMQKVTGCPACQGSGTDPHSKMTTCQTCGGSGRLNVAEGPMQFTKACPDCQGHGKTGKTCPQCGGTGRVAGSETIKVVIPRGVKDGSKVRLSGKGEPGINGGQPGDLYLIIHIKPHPLLKREGNTLFMEVPVTVGEAMSGGTITIPTIDGQLKVKVPPRSQSGQTLRLKGKGAVNPKTKDSGDFMVKLIVKVPTTDDRDILEAAENMDRFYKEDVRKDVRL